MTLKLVIGNKNYSSWSMRPWLAMRAGGLAFEEIFIPLYTDQADKDRILGFTAFGVEAGEAMAVVQTAMLAGLPYTALRDMVLTHPTIAEGLGGLFSTVPARS